MGDGCAPLVVGDLVVSPKALRVPGRRGFINAFRVSAGFGNEVAKRLTSQPNDAFSGALELGLRNACFPSGYAEVSRVGDRASPSRVLLTYVISPREQKALLATGVEGHMVVALGPTQILDTTSDEGDAQPDEQHTALTLPRGVTPLLVLLERTGSRAGAWLRLLAEDGMPLRSVAFAADVENEVCSAGELLDYHEDRLALSVGSFNVAVRPTWEGLAPFAGESFTLTARLDKAKAAAFEGTLSREALMSETAPIALTVPVAKAGKRTLELSLDDSPAYATSLLYRPRLTERLVKLKEGLSHFDPTAVPPASRASFEAHLTLIEGALQESHRDEAWIRGLIEDAEKVLKAAEKGADPYLAKTGIVRRAYLAPQDGSLQSYLAYVPRSYKPAGKPKPLVVVLHGLDNPMEIALRTLIGEPPKPEDDRGVLARHLPAFPDYGAFLVAPSTFGNVGPRPLGEEDVLRVVAEMKQAYRIDPQRVSITGYSMGGTGAFTLPIHFPDLFSASAPLCGYANLHTYRDVTGVPHEPFEEVALARRASIGFVENALHIPFQAIHGGLDDPARSAVMISKMKQAGVPARIDLQDDMGHDVWTYGYEKARMIAWLTPKTAPRAPEHVVLVAGEHRYNRAYWVELLGMREAPARIDATFKPKDLTLDVDTQNVAHFALDLKLLGVTGDVQAKVDGQPLTLPPSMAKAYLSRNEGGWIGSDKPPRLEGRKRALVSGPLDDWQRHEALIVYGTRLANETESNQMLAELLASGRSYREAHFPIRRDVDLTDAEAKKTLVLVGRPAANTVTERFAKAFPVAFDAGGLTLRGARYEGKNVGVAMIRPHPENPSEYVVLYAGVSRTGVLAARHLPELLPDFLVFDERISTKRSSRLLAGRPVLAGGYFDEAWE